ncbi:hypothetical protein AAG570_000221 [Ranatra chinensis]|uniref:ADP-ribosylation factor-binding protein GGA1 n=1 Tax=Ranatra chinensis TaxID=642074 RepID=A0ABD0YWG7_9HEMI
MDIITTSLEALIQRATSVSNQGPDTAAIDAFCGLVNKEPECAQMAAKFITAKIYSLNEWEALQALLVLENCMKRCGGVFHAEVGKFRFLNELVKLVSPKYLGSHTPEPVRQRVLELMHLWTVQYPRETKIKEAYDMLKKQGVVKEIPVPVKEPTQRHHQSSILQDEEKSQLLQKLLQSKNPDDLQAANRLIKSMVKEDERRLEEKWRHTVELETVVNNCRLLKEMLDNYSSDSSSPHDLELIKELYTTCQNLRPVLFKLAGNNSDASFCNDVLTANDELGEVFNKYNVVIQGFSNASHQFSHIGKGSDSGNTPSLLDLTPSPIQNVEDTTEQLSRLGLDLSAPTKQSLNEGIKKDNSGYLAALDEIFNSQPVTNIPSASQLMSPVNSTGMLI